MSDPKTPDNKFIIDKDEAEEIKTIKGGLNAAEAQYAKQDRERREAEADLDVEIISNLRGSSDNPVQPVRLTGEDGMCFSCHKGVSCWNECCHDTDITLTPMDIISLSAHLNLSSADFLARFTLPAMWDQADLPVVKLRVADGEEGEKKPCIFLDDEAGCTVYADRPASCRYYPLGLAAVKMKGHTKREDFYFMVKEPHCKGHEEKVDEITVNDYRKSQGVEIYDEVNRGWIDIIMKMASWKVMGGPQGKELDLRTKKMFFMVSTDPGAFRRFVFDSKFLETYEIDDNMAEQLKTDDGLLLQLGCDWLKHIMFGEETINLRENILQEAITKARRDFGAG